MSSDLDTRVPSTYLAIRAYLAVLVPIPVQVQVHVCPV